MKNKNIAIQLQNVTKIYELHHHKPTFSDRFIRKNQSDKFVALDRISISIQQGEKVGILGMNGAGKTTLLKIISGITTPNHGKVIVNGKVVSLIDLEAGFHPDLSGEENVYLNGLVIGMTKKEIQECYPNISRFAEIGKFIHSPMFTYSAGMKLRLGFSIAVHANPDLLILDENISAGDEGFKLKSSKKIEEFFHTGRTVIIVSHWLEYLLEHCDRFIWMEKGRIRKVGGPGLVTEYRRSLE